MVAMHNSATICAGLFAINACFQHVLQHNSSRMTHGMKAESAAAWGSCEDRQWIGVQEHNNHLLCGGRAFSQVTQTISR